MANALLAALSPSEDDTLRAIAHGRVHPKSLQESDVGRLKRLGLIEECRTGLSLSAVGQQRLGIMSAAALDRDHRLDT